MFADDRDSPIHYMQRTRDWYLALGYDNPYRWAHYADVPFSPLRQALSKSTVTLITTAAPYRADKGDQGPGSAYNAAAKFYDVYSGDTSIDHDLRVSHVAIDRDHTSMEDSNCWFPLAQLRQAHAEGKIGKISSRFHGVPTNRSQRHTIEVDCPEIVARCQADSADAAILVANCPVCHQTLSLVARHLETAGISTILMGCAKDVVEHCGVPRFLFSDFPLGNAAGKPHDLESQKATLSLTLKLLESAPAPRTTLQSAIRWSESFDWKMDYANPSRLSLEQLNKLKAENDQAKLVAKALRENKA